MAYDNNDKPDSTQPDRNPDPITGAPGSHPLGTGIGTGSGALTGAALGSIGGPVGAAIGLIAGGIVGAITGHKAGEYNDPTEDFSRPGDHADPVARTTNPTPTASTTTSGRPAEPMMSPYSGLDDDDATYYRSSHKTGAYAEHDFDNDLAPAYGYGSEVGRHASSSGSKFDDLDNDVRQGWDHVKGTSKLTYDQARSAIREAYDRRQSNANAPTGEVRLNPRTVDGARSNVGNIQSEAVKVDRTGDARMNEESSSGSR